MKLWTIQPRSLYEKLLAQGTLHCDPECEGFWGLDSEEFKSAYDWIVAQMKERVSLPSVGVRYPFWAWALIDGVSKKPDLRRTEFNNYVGENVVIELEIPDTEVLLSDEENWHYVLNNWYLHDLNSDDGKWEETDAWFNSLPPDLKDSMKRQSWEKIFHKDDTDNGWEFVQATFWELRMDQVKSVRHFKGRGQIIKTEDENHTMSDDLRNNLDKLHTTALGVERIRKNLSLTAPDIIAWCRKKILASQHIERKGKNWYVYTADAVITINAHSYTVITGHKPGVVRVRDITPADYPELENFLYHAIFVPPGVEPPPRDIIHHPDVFVYIDGFGDKRGDCGVVAQTDGRIVGAAWERIIPAFGHIDDDTPELAISVLPEYRGRAIGTLMMTRLSALLREHGYPRTSLAVQKENAAVRFYQRLGYETIRESDEEFIMIKDLTMRESDK